MKNGLIVTFLIIVILIMGCDTQTNTPTKVDDNEEVFVMEEETEDSDKVEEVMDDVQESDNEIIVPKWAKIELKDVRTQESFMISDFIGEKPILLESFAVWCPICKKQQDEIRDLHEIVGNSVVSIAIDTDPNEDESNIQGHLDKHGYDWLYAVSPVEMTQFLKDEFGLTFINAPSAPVVLICEDGSTRFLKSGVKRAADLKNEVSKGC